MKIVFHDDVIDKFIVQRTMGIVGASDNEDKFGYLAYRELKRRGYTLYPVNNIKTIKIDTTKDADVAEAVTLIKEQKTGLWALVNNAGVLFPVTARVKRQDNKHFKRRRLPGDAVFRAVRGKQTSCN